MRVAGYLRVSTDEQATRGFSLEAQQQAISAYATGRGWEIARWYTDAGLSAFTDKAQKRPAFAALLADVAARQWDAVIILKLDRLARSVRVSADTLAHFRAHGCALISVSEGWDFGSISGQFLYHIMGALAEMESATGSERTKRGVAVRRGKGFWHGVVPWGAVTVGGVIAVDPAKAALVAWALATLAHAPFLAVAAELNRRGEPTARGAVWRPFSVEQWLNHADWLLTQPDPWPALLVAARARPRQPHIRRDRDTAMLTGLLLCACGGRITTSASWVSPDGTRRWSLRCRNHDAARPTGAGCPHRLTDRAHYEALVTSWLHALPDLQAPVLVGGDDDAALAAQRGAILARRRRVGLAYADGALDEPAYRTRLAALAIEEARLPPPAAQTVALAQAIARAQRDWHRLLPPARNAFLRGTVAHFLVQGRALQAVPHAALTALLGAYARQQAQA